MCETKAVVVSISIIILVAISSAYIKPIPRTKWDTTAKSKVKVFANMGTRSFVLTVASAII